MPRGRGLIALELFLTAPVLFAGVAVTQSVAPPATPAQTSATKTAPKAPVHHKSRKIEKPLVLPPLPSGPLSQLPMDQIPTTPAKVSFQDGLLSISAQNSTLGEILGDVRKLTGASIEIPPGSAASERVVAHLGPGAPRDVLVVLLNGSSFNYVMVGSKSDPAAVSSVVLLPKAGGAPEVQTVANAAPNNQVSTPQAQFARGGFNRGQIIVQQSPQPGNPQPANAEEDKSADDDSDSSADNADDQAQPGQAMQPGANGQDQAQQPDPNQPNSGPKTPEQILEMLRRPQQPPGGGVVTTPPQQPPDQ
jgi:hypothetical protein